MPNPGGVGLQPLRIERSRCTKDILPKDTKTLSDNSSSPPSISSSSEAVPIDHPGVLDSQNHACASNCSKVSSSLAGRRFSLLGREFLRMRFERAKIVTNNCWVGSLIYDETG